jgi:hypothetical protein
MNNLRAEIEQRIRVFVVPKADGGNHEDAYASLKRFCDETLGGEGSPEEIITTQILNDVKHHLRERRKGRKR